MNTLDDLPPLYQHEAREMLEKLPLNIGSNDDDLTVLAVELQAFAERIRTSPGGNFPPTDPPVLLPEALIDPAAIAPLLDANYAALVERGRELLASASAWKADAKGTSITTQEKADELADVMMQLAGFANPTNGEVEAARKKVKEPVYLAGKEIDAWFAGQRDGILAIMGIKPFPAGRGTMSGELTAWAQAELTRKRAAAQAEADRLAREAREAKVIADAAVRDDVATEETVEQAVTEAIVTEDAALRAQQQAQASDTDMVRSTSARGVTTGLRGTWRWRLVDLEALVVAAAAQSVMIALMSIPEIGQSESMQKRIRAKLAPDGTVPLEYLTPAERPINAAIAGDRGRRDCPGLEIYLEQTANLTRRK